MKKTTVKSIRITMLLITYLIYVILALLTTYQQNALMSIIAIIIMSIFFGLCIIIITILKDIACTFDTKHYSEE